MDTRTGLLPVDEALAQVHAVLNRVDPDRAQLAPEARLRAAMTARGLSGRLDALASVLLGEADAARASERATGTPMSTWMAIDQNLTKREAAGALHRAAELAAHPVLGAAAVAGRVSTGQVRAINTVLGGLAPQLDAGQQAQAEQLLVGMADQLDSDALSKAAPQVLARVAPAGANQLLETTLQREAEAAQRNRSLRFWRQGGSVRFEGCLPRVDGEQFITLIDTHGEALRRTAVEARDPLFTAATPEQRRADALIHLLRHAATARPQPGVGAAKVIVKLDYDQLKAGAAGAGVVGDSVQLSAGELRRVCCDAEIIPVVLRGGSEVLDVGRIPPTGDPRDAGSADRPRRWLRVPRLQRATLSLPSPPHHPVVAGRFDRTFESGPVVSPPPRPGRTSQIRPTRPMASPDQRNRPATRVHPTIPAPASRRVATPRSPPRANSSLTRPARPTRAGREACPKPAANPTTSPRRRLEGTPRNGPSAAL